MSSKSCRQVDDVKDGKDRLMASRRRSSRAVIGRSGIAPLLRTSD